MMTEFLLVTLARTSVFLAMSAIVASLWIRWRRPGSPFVHQAIWFVVLLQGVVWLRMPVTLPVQMPFAAAVATRSQSEDPQLDRPTLRDPSETSSAARVVIHESSSAIPPDEHRENSVAPSPPESTPSPFPWQATLVIAWLMGVSALVINLAIAYFAFRTKFRTDVMPHVPQEWNNDWQRMLRNHGIAAKIELLASATMGPLFVWRPNGSAFVVPFDAWSDWTASERRAVMRHEIAHYQRRDALWFLAVRLLASLHWFNPLAWFAVRKFELGAEWACDLAAAPTQAERPAYARLLLSLTQRNANVPAVHAFSSPPLARRIQLLLSPNSEDAMFRRLITLCLPLLILGIAAFDAVPAPGNGLTKESVLSMGTVPNPVMPEPSQDSAKSKKAPAAKQKELKESREKRDLERAKMRAYAQSPEAKRSSERRRSKDTFNYWSRIVLFEKNLDQAALLDLALNFLNVSPPENEAIETWVKLAGANWSGDSIAEIRSNLVKVADQKPVHKFDIGLQAARSKFIELGGDDLDWRVRKNFWLDTASHFLATVSNKRSDFSWQRFIGMESDRGKVDVYRQAYLASLVVVANGQQPDFELLKNMDERGTVPAAGEFQLRYFAKLHAFAKAKVPVQSPDWEMLLKQPTSDRDRRWLKEVGAYVQTITKINNAEANDLVVNFSRHYSGIEYAEMLQHAGIESNKIDELLLSQPTYVNVVRAPFSKVFEELKKTRAASFWVDPSVYENRSAVTVNLVRAKLIDVVHAIAKQAKLRVHNFGGRVLWIGPDAAFAGAEKLFKRSLDRMKGASGRPAHALVRDVDLQYNSTPLSEAFDFLRDYNQMNIILLKPLPTDQALSVKNCMPTHLWLTTFTNEIGLDWMTQGELVLVGTADQFDDMRQRFSRAVSGSEKIQRALNKTIDLQYNETPFSEVLNFLRDYHKINVVNLSPKEVNTNITLTVMGSTTRQALDLACQQKGLEWRVVGDTLYVGTRKDLDNLETKNQTSADKSSSDGNPARNRDGVAGAKPPRDNSTNKRLVSVLDKLIDVHIGPRLFADSLILFELYQIPCVLVNKGLASKEFARDISGTPAGEYLDLICHQASVEWVAYYDCIFFGTADELAKLKVRIDEHSQRRHILQQASADGDKLAEILLKPVQGKKPVTLSSILNQAKIELALPKEVDDQTSKVLSAGDSLDWILERSLIPLGYRWEYVDGKVTLKK